MNKLAVIALGGNALLRGDQIGTIEEQEDNAYATLKNVVYLIKEGYDIILSHGNGPQVGNILMQNAAGEQIYKIAPMPIDICVADSQGGIGYIIERMLRNILIENGIQKSIVTLVTQVMVDKDDPAFKNPTKRVGKIYDKQESEELARARGWVFKEEIKVKGGWRRVVPSPNPKSIVNVDIIEDLARKGNIVITVGGGGIPVYIDEKSSVRPLEAVIDKDLASALLANTVKANEFYVLTDVPFIYLNYKQPNEEKLTTLRKADAEKYLAGGMFGEGSMAPKVKAALRFLENGGEMAIITESTKLEDKSYGTKLIN